MTVASEIQRIEGNISAAYTAADAKGATMPATENSDNLATCIASIPAGGGGGYQLRRITDDSNNEIGTAFTEFEDANGNKFDVVCLDAVYRLASANWCSSSGLVTNLPIYNSNVSLWWYDNAKETATQNTQLILDYGSANGYTTTACSHCRSQSFTISGTTYYGQLPNIREIFDMWRYRVQLESMDTSASSQSSTNFSSERNIWSSSQCTNNFSWYLKSDGAIGNTLKTSNFLACPVIELPK